MLNIEAVERRRIVCSREEMAASFERSIHTHRAVVPALVGSYTRKVGDFNDEASIAVRSLVYSLLRNYDLGASIRGTCYINERLEIARRQ